MIEELSILARIAIEDDLKNNPPDPDFPKEEAIKQLYDTVYSKVEKEVLNNYSKSIEMKIKKELNSERISGHKELVISGFLLALIVGLLVNQVTEIINSLKNSACLSLSTIIVSLFLFFLCWAIFSFSISHKLKEFLNDIYRETLRLD